MRGVDLVADHAAECGLTPPDPSAVGGRLLRQVFLRGVCCRLPADRASFRASFRGLRGSLRIRPTMPLRQEQRDGDEQRAEEIQPELGPRP